MNPRKSNEPRLHEYGCRELRRRGWRVNRGASGSKVTDRFKFLGTLDRMGPQIFLRWQRGTGFYLEAEGDYLDIQLKLAEFFEVYFSHQILDKSSQS